MNTKGRESDGEYFFAVKDPEGCINHTTVSMDEEYAVEQFLKTEQTMDLLANSARIAKGIQHVWHSKSWEQFEAEGFSIVTIRLVEIPCPANPNTTHTL